MLPLDELYQEVILDHYKNPKNQGTIENPDYKGHGVNPLCGDDVEIWIKLENGKIKSLKSIGKGCAVSQASLSMMGEALQGKSIEEARQAVEKFKKGMLEGGELHFEEYPDLEALEGVKKFPVRIKCAVLPWNTFLEALESHPSA
jgi:nitrogen fixation NifU-like protein